MSKAYILGGAQSDFERNWTKEGKTSIALLKETMADALANTQVSYEEIKKLNADNRVACYVANYLSEDFTNQAHVGTLLTKVHPAFYGVPSAKYEAACASSSIALDAAITKVQAEEYDLAIVVGFELMKTVDSKTCGDFLGKASDMEEEAKGIAFPFPKLFGRLADATLEKYDVDEERYMNALARISVNNYENGKRNPLAQTRKWFMNYEQASTRGTETNAYVGNRLAISDCSQVTDGAAIVLIASEKYLQEKNLTENRLPYVKGYGHRVAPLNFSAKIAENKDSDYVLPWTRQAVVDAYKRANLTVDDIDVFETHDCFTSSEYVAISCFGITEPGKEYEAVENGTIAFDGDKPINPSGGLIACGHPVGVAGCRMMLDLYKQISGNAGGYQVRKKDGSLPDNAMLLNLGGSATTNCVFIIGV